MHSSEIIQLFIPLQLFTSMSNIKMLQAGDYTYMKDKGDS